MQTVDNQKMILIVDDTVESLSMLNEALSAENYTVLVAMDGEQALTIAERMKPDLILLDAVMPKMDGFATCEALKKNVELQDVPVIFMTGLSDSEDIVRGLKTGGVDYLTKPLVLEEVLARVEVHLANARKTQSIRDALNEIGQLAFSCNLKGEILWCTSDTSELLGKWDTNVVQLAALLEQQGVLTWLARQPEKRSQTLVSVAGHNMNVRILAQPNPGEFLLSFVAEDDLYLCDRLRREFSLTERESEVLLWLSRGKSNQDIAQILTMSPRTVNKHLEPIFRKLAVENRTSAAAISLGFLSGISL